MDSLRLRLPVISELTLKSSMARFSDTFATLFSAGIPVIECLEAVRGVLDNVIIAEKVDGIIDAIKRVRHFQLLLKEAECSLLWFTI